MRRLLLSLPFFMAPAFMIPDTPRLGLGLAALGRPGYINLKRQDHLQERSAEAMQMRCHEVLDKAYALGLRYYDCARSYGRSEEFLSAWLRKRNLNGEQVGDNMSFRKITRSPWAPSGATAILQTGRLWLMVLMRSRITPSSIWSIRRKRRWNSSVNIFVSTSHPDLE